MLRLRVSSSDSISGGEGGPWTCIYPCHKDTHHTRVHNHPCFIPFIVLEIPSTFDLEVFDYAILTMD
jgi:hypothetical protein